MLFLIAAVYFCFINPNWLLYFLQMFDFKLNRLPYIIIINVG
jgi:hypothetical protein